LASLWSLVILLTWISFFSALVYATSSANDDDSNQNNYNYNNDQDENNSQDNYEYQPELVVTSRALAFAALWTFVLSLLLSIFGTVVLGWQSPTGQYYTCCSSNVHRTTPLGLGSFIGALIMFGNLTLICSVLFGEFEVRDFREGEDRGNGDGGSSSYARADRSSIAFSIMCVFLTLLYAGFAALTFSFAHNVIQEQEQDVLEEARMPRKNTGTFGYNGYIGERFDVARSKRSAGFVPQTSPDATLT